MTEPFPTWKEHQEEGTPLVLTPELAHVLRQGIAIETHHEDSELHQMLRTWSTLTGQQP